MKTISTNPRSGIALVIVLGVLSLMVLMAVSFAISMRTERVAAGNQMDTVRARHLARVGLVRAMDQLYRECGRDLPDSNLVYQEWAVTNSYTLDPTNAPPVDLLKGSASNFVPRSLWDAAVAANDTNSSNSSNYWISIISEVQDPANPTNGTTNLIGRVAFMILNCSGLLDANFVGGAAREIGTNPVEIALGALPEVRADFFSFRNNDVRYETQEELNELADINFPATNLFIYSRAPAGYYTNNAPMLVGTQVNLGGSREDLVGRRDAIVDGFKKSGFSSEDSENLFLNLINYATPYGEGLTPVNSDLDPDMMLLYEPIVRPVPMINEVVLSNTIKLVSSVNGTNLYNSDTALHIELWYPFIETPSIGEYKLRFSSGIPYSDPAGFADIPLTEKTSSSLPNDRFSLLSFVKGITVTSSPGILTIGISNLIINLYRPKPDGADEMIDAWQAAPTNLYLTTTLTNVVGNIVTKMTSMECIDPRFNWNPQDSKQWVVLHDSSGTLLDTNKSTILYWGVNPTRDTNSEMYVSGEPLKTAGELGYLVYDRWQTIKLCGLNADRVLDYFAIETNCDEFVTNVVWRGRVNPNTTNREVLTAVFTNMPVDEYPGQNLVNVDQFLTNQAVDVADFIIANGPYTNMSDVCRLDWQTFFADPAFSGIVTNELQREAFIRNTAGLLSTRGQVYTILIEAQVASGGNIPKNPSRQRAVAVVWRDAWTGEMIVRYLKWLPD